MALSLFSRFRKDPGEAPSGFGRNTASGFGQRRSSRSFSTSRTWGESTFEVARWERARRAGRRWAIAGAVVGVLAGLVWFAPATWLAGLISRLTAERVLLADAQGTIWSGSAVAVLTGGAGSRDARSLPGRLQWTLRPGLAGGFGLVAEVRHACCVNGSLGLTVRPGWGRVTAVVHSAPGWAAQWPAAWLTGLGTPFNTMQLGGALRLSTQDLVVQWVQGRVRIEGSADVELRDMSSRLATLPRLGSYRLSVRNNPGQAGTSSVTLETIDGALRLTGVGTWSATGLRLRGEAVADEDDQPALNNLLNLIGRRDGVRSIISIG